MSKTLRTVGVIVGFLLFWEAACRLFNLPTYFLPAPSLVLAEICAEPRWYLEHCGYTLFTTALGFGLAVLVGVSGRSELRSSPCHRIRRRQATTVSL
jgi:ABC-type nitrate/sulfonate/bicarbonate transport system permease component